MLFYEVHTTFSDFLKRVHRFLLNFVSMKRHGFSSLYILLVIAGLFLFAACASIGRPSGGDYDIEPPVYVSSNPKIGETNVDRTRLTITFNENVKVSDVMTKVVVSPAQKQIPAITANGKNVSVELKDSLIPNTTYTIDFSDAIRDLNEENELDGFSMEFSTGETIDTMRISGIVLEARNLEPAQGMLVGVYRADSTDILRPDTLKYMAADTLRAIIPDSVAATIADSLLRDSILLPKIMSLPMERIARTNQLGQFTIRGLSPGTYRIYAVNDVNRDYHWDVSEDVAFYDVTLSPSAVDDMHTDTLTTETGTDSIVDHKVTTYLPNDILLTWFNEGRMTQYLKDYSRNDRKKLLIQFSAPVDTLPEITLLNGPRAGETIDKWAVMNTREGRDSLDFFITDTAVIAQDTMQIAMRYLRTDTLNKLSWGNDTLRVLFKGAREEARQKEKAEKEQEKWMKEIEEHPELEGSIRAAHAPQPVFLDITLKSGTTQEVYLPAIFEFKQPIDSMIMSNMRLTVQRDSLTDTIAAPPLERVDSFDILTYKLDYKWAPATKYTFIIDSAAVTGVYNHNKEYKAEFTTRALEDYSALFFNIAGVRDSALVEVLDGSDKPVETASVKGGIAEFPYLQPGTYYARLYIDRNGNGKYDTGNLIDGVQPEEVYYFPKKINLKKNWDVEESWNIYETAVDLQKPKEIIKNKPKEKKRRRNKDGSYVNENGKDDDEEEDEYDQYDQNSNFFGPGNGNGTNNIGNNRNNMNMGGFRQAF